MEEEAKMKVVPVANPVPVVQKTEEEKKDD